MNIGRGSRYKVTSPPDDPALSEMEQIDAIIERSVTFEITEAHHDNIGLKEIYLDGEMSGGDIPGPMVASVQVDPLSTIEGHPRWQTGQELIDYLDSDPNVFRGEFDGNRWQGMGVPWVECPANIKECFDRLESTTAETLLTALSATRRSIQRRRISTSWTMTACSSCARGAGRRDPCRKRTKPWNWNFRG